MKILWQFVAFLMVVYQTQSQYQRQQTFSDSGNILPYSFYFDVHQSQTVTVSFSTRCPNLRIMFVNQGGSVFYNYAPSYRNDGYTYTFNVGIGGGMSQSISLIDWSNARSCSWSYSFKLSFNCSIVTANCNDCNSYTNCWSCLNGYFLYMNKCYKNIQNCVTRSGLECAVCASGYVLVNGACRLCSSFMPDCKTCPTTSQCSACFNGYALTAGNLGCDKCSNFIPDCTVCSSSTVCTSCPYGYALANPTTCQLCTATLSNCKQCASTTKCLTCNTGYAVAGDWTCQTCSSFVSDCLLCSNSGSCTKCSPGFSFSPSACTPCTTTVVGCKSCLGPDCLSCEDGYWFDNGDCKPCTATISNCQICINSTWCDTCATGTGLTGTTTTIAYTTTAGVITSTTIYHRRCASCSAMSQCLTCSSTTQCNSCNQFYTIYGSSCYSCAIFLYACSNCSSIYTCTTCLNNQYTLDTDNRCYSCSSYMDNCNTCSDRSTCTTCKAGTVLKDSRCKPCYIVIPFCKTCITQLTCTVCQTAYQRDPTSGSCKPCEFFLANCSDCSSPTVCTRCIPGTILNNGKCKTCAQVFPNCIACVSNVSCALCGSGSIVFQGYCETCKTFINHCDNCLQLPYCEECFEPYITDQNKKCMCRPPLYNVSDFCVPDKNCVNAYKKNGQVYCSFCNIKNLFYLDKNSKCVCKAGYKQINEQCVEYCGDGMIVNHQCDDNNTENGDGCSSQCKIQPDFTCSQLPSGLSYCRFIKNIELHYKYTFKKLHDNKGQITVCLLSSDPSIQRFYNSDLFKFNIFHNRSDSLNITSFYKNDQGDIVIDIDYNETIQYTSVELKFKFDAQYVVSLDNTLKFQFKGSNYPLVISSMTQNYKFNSNIMKYLALGGYVVALLSLFSDKFIAVEGLNTIQLTFFSLLLIYQNSNWPQAVVALLPLKYSTGFNPLIFQPNSFDNINSVSYRKFQYLGICNYFLPNNLINSLILFITVIVFLVAYKVKLGPQNEISDLHDGPQKKKLTRKLERIRKVFRKIYNITFHFSYIMILQVIVSIYVEISFAKSISVEMKSINKFIVMMTLSIIFITILENYSHFFLSGKDTYVQNFQVGSRQMKYRRVYFIYIIFNAVCIFFLYDKKIFKFTMSFYVLIVAVIYLLFLAIYRPYKHSFLIHGFTVLLNQVMYVIALLVVNAINFQLKLPQIYFLVFSYLIMSLTFIVLLFIVLRVFYQYKYGQEKIKQQIQFQIEGHKKQEKQFLLNKTAQIEDRNKQNKKNSQNSYLYQNQKLQAQKIDFLNQLKGKHFLSEWEKDQAFFRAYDRKPINWVEQNQTQEKYKILLQKEKQRFQRDIQKQKMIKTKNQKLLNKNYVEEMQIIKEKLRNEHSIKQTKKANKKQQKKSKQKNADKTERIQT